MRHTLRFGKKTVDNSDVNLREPPHCHPLRQKRPDYGILKDSWLLITPCVLPGVGGIGGVPLDFHEIDKAYLE